MNMSDSVHTRTLLWRVAKHTVQCAAFDMSVGGAKATGGRWSSKGGSSCFKPQHPSPWKRLRTWATILQFATLFLLQIDVLASVWKLREIIQPADLNPTWVAEPWGSTTVSYGDNWLGGASAPLLMVPSVIVPEEYNVLINPMHLRAKRLQAKVMRQFVYDPRF